MNVGDNETTEGPGFVSQAFRNNLALLETWVAAHAGELPLRHGKRDNETKLSEWIHRIRKAHKARCLNLTQLDLLKSIPSISIEHADAAWEKTCVELRSWLEKHHRTNEDGSNTWQYPRQHAEDTTERKLADWLKHNRRWQNEAASVIGGVKTGQVEGVRPEGGKKEDYGFLLELAFPRNVVNTNTFAPPNNFSFDVTWQP